MKKLLIVFISILTSYNIIAQNESNLKDECFSSNIAISNSVKEFKEYLIFKLEVNKLTIGKMSYDIEFLHSEKFKSETSLVQINDSIALKISVARLIDYGNKKYAYKLDLFELKDNCWRPKNSINHYNEFSLGTVSSGYGSGMEGSIDYLYIEGAIIIE